MKEATYKSKHCMIQLMWGIKGSQIQRKNASSPGLEREGGKGITGQQVWTSAWEDKKILEMESGDRYRTMYIHLMPENCTLKDGYNDRFYVVYIYHNFSKQKCLNAGAKKKFPRDLLCETKHLNFSAVSWHLWTGSHCQSCHKSVPGTYTIPLYVAVLNCLTSER